MTASPSVILSIGGRRFDGWKSVAIERRLDALCGAFSLGLTERWPGQAERWRIEAGDACRLEVDGEVLMTGWVGRARYQLSPTAHPLEISGADRTIDLVDCSAIHSPGFWLNRTIDQIAADLARPFGIGVRAEAPVGSPFARFGLEPGESVLTAIERMAVLRGLLATTDAAGDLVLTRPSQQAASFILAEGELIQDVIFDNDVADRFSRYVIKGHDASDESAGSAAARPSGEAADSGVRRHRPLLIVADEAVSTATLAATARWEASVRAARAQTVTVMVGGWRTPAGDLYRPNVIVPIRAPTVGIEADLLVSGVRYVRSATQGSRTELTLVRPESYSLKPVEAAAGRRTAAAPPQTR
ncbi:hypothetical protein GVN24_24795 [Rhizobium sp. CRIBSB]|nr:hypothetical protein [Rhizobium sp. CRIBSB]